MEHGLPEVRRAMGGEISWCQAAEILDMDVRSLLDAHHRAVPLIPRGVRPIPGRGG